MDSGQQIDFSSAIGKIQDLHSNTAVLASLIRLLKDTNSNIDDIARLLKTDGPLVSTIIRVSNSAYYARGQKVNSVEAALNAVGLDEALRIVGIVISKNIFMKDLRAYGLSADYYWTYSYFCAVFLEKASQQIAFDRDEAYLIGMLHAVGKVIINEVIDAEEVEILWDPTIPAQEWEDVMVGFRYPTAGSLLLKNWNFENRICDYIKHQCDSTCLEEKPILELLDFARTTVELNNADLSLSEWGLPADHSIIEKIDEANLSDLVMESILSVTAIHSILLGIK